MNESEMTAFVTMCVRVAEERRNTFAFMREMADLIEDLEPQTKFDVIRKREVLEKYYEEMEGKG